MLFIVLFTIFIVCIPIGVYLMIMLYPYGYICVNNKICTNIHIYEVLLNDKKWEPTIDENKTLIYTLKSSMFTVK